MQSIQNNFKDAPWFGKVSDDMVSVLGMGGIGSNTLYNLAKTFDCPLFIIDYDRVEEHNIGSQFFGTNDLGDLKVEAIKHRLAQMAPTVTQKIYQAYTKIQDVKGGFAAPITICGFDNMEARKFAFERWKRLENRELFIDGRLRATQYEIFTVTPNDEVRYEATLFDDSEIKDDSCTFKQTSYAGMLIGARITSILANYFSNKYGEEAIFSVPFHYKELLELCLTIIKE